MLKYLLSNWWLFAFGIAVAIIQISVSRFFPAYGNYALAAVILIAAILLKVRVEKGRGKNRKKEKQRS